MTIQTTQTAAPRRLWMRSALAVVTGLLAVLVLSLGTDQILHDLKIYPPWKEGLHAPALNLLALTYRSIYAIVGSYIAAILSPRRPMQHALALGAIGLVLSIVGLIATSDMNLGPRWYPIALVLSALPCAWLGGVLFHARQRTR